MDWLSPGIEGLTMVPTFASVHTFCMSPKTWLIVACFDAINYMACTLPSAQLK